MTMRSPAMMWSVTARMVLPGRRGTLDQRDHKALKEARETLDQRDHRGPKEVEANLERMARAALLKRVAIAIRLHAQAASPLR